MQPLKTVSKFVQFAKSHVLLTPLHPWEWPSQPWSHIHLDFAGPFLGHYFLVIIDAHSKWLDVHIMASITSSKTIEKLRIIFANHGLPRKVVTDNGPSFTSEEFREFLSDNWNCSCNYFTIPSIKQWISRACSANIQEENQVHSW